MQCTEAEKKYIGQSAEDNIIGLINIVCICCLLLYGFYRVSYFWKQKAYFKLFKIYNCTPTVSVALFFIRE